MSDEFVRKTIKLNAELWNTFQQKIEEEYGTTYKHTSEEIEKAIDNYNNEDIIEIEKTKEKIKKLEEENLQLKKENKELLKENNKNDNTLLELKNENKKQNEKIQNQKVTIDTLNRNNSELNDKIISL